MIISLPESSRARPSNSPKGEDRANPLPVFYNNKGETAEGIGQSYLAFYNNVTAYYSCIRGNEQRTTNNEQNFKHMKKRIFGIFGMALFAVSLMAQPAALQVGDKAPSFNLLNVDGEYVSLSDYSDQKGVVLIFTCNHCPYAVAWEDRIIALHHRFADEGFPVVAINPNDSVVVPADSYTEMQKRAREKGFPFPYLLDAEQDIYPLYGATRTPHIYLLERGEDGGFYVRYIGALDNNYREAHAVTETYLADAITALLKGEDPDPTETRAIGCTIKKQD